MVLNCSLISVIPFLSSVLTSQVSLVQDQRTHGELSDTVEKHIQRNKFSF